MSSFNPIWYHVLHHFDNKGYVYNGLTLPFLIGASSILNSNNSPMSISNFVNEIMNNSLPTKISMMKCGGINEYVFGILDKESEKLLGSYIKPIYKQFDNFVITDDSFSELKNIDDIINALSKEYGNNIKKSKFSINNGNWDYFNAKDIERISEIK